METSSISMSKGLNDETKLFRYMGLSQFLSLVEQGMTSLTRISTWDDTWEAPTLRLRSDRRVLQEQMAQQLHLLFGQCWSLELQSDALWRIYSPHKEGLMIETTAKRFHLIQGIIRAQLGAIVYFDDLREGANMLNSAVDYDRGVVPAFLKRKAFVLEKEVRLVLRADKGWLSDSLHAMAGSQDRLFLPVNPQQFLEQITIDPRASDEFVRTIQRYCDRVGLPMAVKSPLYCSVHEGTDGLTREELRTSIGHVTGTGGI